MDHGILNTSLKSRGNIDNQIDAYKSQVAAAKKAKAKADRASFVANQKAAKALLASVSDERMSALAERVKQPVAALRKRLASESHWNPTMIIKLFSASEAA